MAMGRKKQKQQELWIPTQDLAQGPSHPFYQKLNSLLDKHGFTEVVEAECAQFYAVKVGRPSIPPVVYFKTLFIGYFEGIDSERGIAWRLADSMALRAFLGYDLTETTPDHSSLSRTRRLISLESHVKIFQWGLKVLAKEKLLDGKTLGVDATTLEANAALRSIVRRDTGESYEEFLTRLAKASGIETPTREDLAKLDKDRPNKGSNEDWMHAHDSDARVAKMKDGRTHMAHKAEHAVDLQSGAIVGVTLQAADLGDTATLHNTLEEAQTNLRAVAADPQARRQLQPVKEVVVDKGYHSNDTLCDLEEEGIRSYASEPRRGRRNWKNKPQEQQAVYANRRRIQGNRGKALLRKRGELVERSFAHTYDTGGMRRTHLRHHDNILKRVLIHSGAFNLSLVFRKQLGAGTPRELRERLQNGLANAAKSLFSTMQLLAASILNATTQIRHSIIWCRRQHTATRSLALAPG
jgi:transposase